MSLAATGVGLGRFGCRGTGGLDTQETAILASEIKGGLCLVGTPEG